MARVVLVILSAMCVACAADDPWWAKTMQLYGAGAPTEEVLRALEKSIAANPLRATAHSNRAVLLHELGADAKEVLASFEASIAVEPRLADGHTSRGAVLEQLGADWNEARQGAAV